MIEVYKIIHKHYDVSLAVNVSLNKSTSTWGNKHKIYNYTFHYYVRKYFFVHE